MIGQQHLSPVVRNLNRTHYSQLIKINSFNKTSFMLLLVSKAQLDALKKTHEMAIISFKSRWLRFVMILLGGTTVFILVVVIFLNSFLKANLSGRLKEAVLQGTDNLYRLDFSKAELHIFSGAAVLYDISFAPDTTVYQRLKLQGLAPGSLYEFRVKRLEVSGAHILDLWLHKKLKVGLISVKDPEIYIARVAEDSHKKPKENQLTLYQKISKTFQLIKVNKISLTGMTVTYRDKSKPKPSVSVLKQLEIQASDLLIDKASQADTSRTLYCRDIVTVLKHYSGLSADHLYKYRIGEVKLSTQTEQVEASDVDIQPADANTFFKKSKSDRFSLHLDKISVSHFNYRMFRRNAGISADRLRLNKGTFKVFTNPNGKLQTTDRLVTFPNWAIRQLKINLTIDTLDIHSLDVHYSEFKKKSGQTGTVRFDQTSGRFLNLTNDQSLLHKDPVARIKLSTMFMDKGKLDLNFIFNLADKDYSYSYKGHLGPMDMTEANAAVMPLGLVKITSGSVERLDFAIAGTQRISRGKVTFLYRDLEVDVLKKDGNKGYAKRGIISLLAGAVILKKDNPDNGKGLPRVAEVVFIRPKNFPFFKTAWLALLTGLKGGAGVGRADEKRPAQPITDEEKKEQAEALKKAKKTKEKADKEFKEKLNDKKNDKVSYKKNS
jgi:hypothetical protein